MSTASHYILYYIVLHYIALHCITLHCITLYYITLHYITLQSTLVFAMHQTLFQRFQNLGDLYTDDNQQETFQSKACGNNLFFPKLNFSRFVSSIGWNVSYVQMRLMFNTYIIIFPTRIVHQMRSRIAIMPAESTEVPGRRYHDGGPPMPPEHFWTIRTSAESRIHGNLYLQKIHDFVLCVQAYINTNIDININYTV